MSKCTNNGKDRIKALQHYRVQDHFAPLRFKWKIKEMESKLGQSFHGIKGIDGLKNLIS